MHTVKQSSIDSTDRDQQSRIKFSYQPRQTGQGQGSHIKVFSHQPKGDKVSSDIDEASQKHLFFNDDVEEFQILYSTYGTFRYSYGS